MHRWVMLREVMAVLERVDRDYEGNLVSTRQHDPYMTRFGTNSILAFSWHSSVSTHVA